ncbi:MAG: hypothetical protein WC404_07275 [Candidatus Omnitrophota bacterium]|jgi:hypothetical protein
MERVSNKNMAVMVEKQKEFKANNVYAVKKENIYIVYSYGEHFPIYIWKDGIWYGNKEKYSLSTSKHQRQALPTAVSNIEWVSLEDMQQLIKIANI